MRRPLSTVEQSVRSGIERHLVMVSEVIGERHVGRPGALEAAARYIEDMLRGWGYEVNAQEYQAEGTAVRNIWVEVPGDKRPDEIVIVGAHYDSVECPAANDNGSGVAGVLEIARMMRRRQFDRTLRFVFFVNEEPPFYKSLSMGSWVYAAECRERGDKIVGMINLETLGCYLEGEGTQRYPHPFNKGIFRWILPRQGNFVAFVGNVNSWRLTWRMRRLFKRATGFRSWWLASPSGVEGPGMSDHWCFWQRGYPAVMVTDTAYFRYDHYHKSSDTIDKLNLDAMARVVWGVGEAAAKFAYERQKRKTRAV